MGQTEAYRIYHHKSYVAINCNETFSKKKEKIQDWQLYLCKGIKIILIVYMKCVLL